MTRHVNILRLTVVILVLGFTVEGLAQNGRNFRQKRGFSPQGQRFNRDRSQQTQNQRQRGPTNRQVGGRTFVNSFRVDGNDPGDLVSLSRRPGQENVVSITLKTPGTLWYKGIAIFDELNREWKIQRQDGNYLGQPVIHIPANRLGDTFQIAFWKAKFLGVHTHVHSQVFSKSDFIGRATTITWNEAGNAEIPDNPDNDGQTVAQINRKTVLDGGDLTIVSSDHRPGYVRIEYSSTIDWWNMVQVRDARGNALTIEMEKGNPYLNNFIQIPTSQLDGIVRIEMWRAKFLGVHTHMGTYEVERRALDGRKIKVEWKAK